MPNSSPHSCIWRSVDRPPGIAGDDVHLWRIDLDASDAVYEGCHALLDDGERARADRFRASRQSQRFAVARGTLRRLLGAYLETEPHQLEFAYAEHGKPFLQHPKTDLHFNVSHSGNAALMVFARGRDLGVDVERTQREVGWERVARRFFAGPELVELMALNPDQRRSGFFRCWTSKEAYMKATGRGITLGLGKFVVRVDPSLPAELLLAVEGSAHHWWLQDVDPGPAMAGALCVSGGEPNIDWLELTLPTLG